MSKYKPHQADDPEEAMQMVVDFVRDFTAKHRYPPSMREVQAGCEFNSLSWVHALVMRCVEEGRLGHTPGISRSLHIPARGKRKVKKQPGRLRQMIEEIEQ